MPDYSADPIWNAATECMVSLDGLPVHRDTRSAIRAWAARWEELAWQQMHAEDVANVMRPGPAEPVAARAWQTVEEEGRALCQRLRTELGDGWRVGWVTVEAGRRHVQWEADGPVTLFVPGTGRRP